jgi:hypothetical protein
LKTIEGKIVGELVAATRRRKKNGGGNLKV